MGVLETRIIELEALVHAMAEELAALRAENTALRAKIARLEKNSGNSSKPPSSDIVKPSKAVKKSGKKRKPGGQKGHPRHLRPPFDELQVDAIVELKLERCPDCGHELAPCSHLPQVVQQVELAPRPVVVTEYRQGRFWCENCQCHHTAPMPPEVENTGLFGPMLTTLVAYLKGRCHMSYTTVQAFFAEVLALEVSTGHLANTVRKVSNAMAPTYDALLEQLSGQSHLHLDETGAKQSGKKRWTWCFRSPDFTVFHVDESRASEVLKNLLGEKFAGVISCDFWGAYRKFARQTSAELQFCWAHLIREVKFLAGSKDKKTANYGRRLLKYIREMFSTIHRRDQLSKLVWKRRMHAHRDAILKTSQRAIPENTDAINISARLRDWSTDYFRFIETGIPPTNNLAEQSIRHVVIDRKITQGTRSDWGNRWLERFWSVLATCRQRGHNLLSFLHSCVESLLHGTAPPPILNT